MKNTISLDRTILGAEDMEIRVLASGYVEIKGKIKYNSKSSALFNKKRRAFFYEQIAPMAFTSCLNSQSNIPRLLFNHDYKRPVGDIVSFDYEDTQQGEFKFKYIVKATDELITNLDIITNFSFGFIADQDQWTKITETEYTRVVNSFATISEFSLLVGLESAYSSAKIYVDDEELKKDEVKTFVSDARRVLDELKQKQKQQELDRMKKIVASYKR